MTDPVRSDLPERKSEPDLFFPSSDSEDDVVPTPLPSSSTIAGPSNPSSSIHPTSSVSITNGHTTRKTNGNGTRHRSNSQTSDIVPIQSSSHLTPSLASGSHKRPSPSRTPSNNSTKSDLGRGYLGEFVCEGWSLSKGKGYCVPGSKVVFERPKPVKTQQDDGQWVERSKEKVGPTRLVNGRVVNAKGKPVVGKQMTLGSMGLGKKAYSAVSRIGYIRCEAG